jgi:hypothetical protein
MGCSSAPGTYNDVEQSWSFFLSDRWNPRAPRSGRDYRVVVGLFPHVTRQNDAGSIYSHASLLVFCRNPMADHLLASIFVKRAMLRSKLLSRFFLAASVFTLIPAVAEACPGCMIADPKNARIYLGMTLMMSALPLLLIGALGYWLWRRYNGPGSNRPTA